MLPNISSVVVVVGVILQMVLLCINLRLRTKEVAPSASHNKDYTAVLEAGLKEYYQNKSGGYASMVFFHEIAAHLNSAIKNYQNISEQEETVQTSHNSAMAPCNIWRDGGTCNVVAYRDPCGKVPCQVVAQHQ